MPWIIGGAILGAGLIGSMSSAESAEQANQANLQATRETNLISDEQARLNREFQSAEAIKNREYQDFQARRQIEFQNYMSDTAYQRAVRDMQGAGLNPMLAYTQGGASSPPGAAGSGSMPSGSQAQTFRPPDFIPINKFAGLGQSMASAVQGFQTEKSQEALLKAQQENVQADTVAKLSSAGELKAREENIRQEMQSFEKRMLKLGWEVRSAEFEAGIKNSEDFIRARMKDLDVGRAEVMRIMAQAAEYQAQAKLLGLQVPEHVAQAAYWTDVGKAGVYGERIGRALGNVGQGLRLFRR